jgi:hypothetical protein
MLPIGTNCNVRSVECEHFLLASIILGSIQNITLTNVTLIRYFYIKTFGLFYTLEGFISILKSLFSFGIVVTIDEHGRYLSSYRVEVIVK